MAEPDGWVRLHPLSPLLSAGRYVLVTLALTFDVWADELPGTAPETDLVTRAGVAVVVGAFVTLGYSAVAWRHRRYRVTADTVELKTGIVFRSSRHLPLQRIESVDIVQSLVPRLLDLAEVRVEAISKQGNELRLRYLARQEAERLRLDLSARRRAGAAEHLPPEGPTSLVLQVPPRELAIGYLVVPAVTGGAVATFAVVVAALVGGWQATLSIFATGAVLAVGGIVRALIRLERLWDFRLEDADDALVVRRGLLNLNTQRILTGRIQALRVEQPLLWRPYGRFRVVVDVAGYRGTSNEAAAAAANVLPIAPYEVVRYLVRRLDMPSDLATLPFHPVPPRARWRSVRWRSFRVAWTSTHAVVGSGVLWRRIAVVPYERLQSVRVVQGPWQRRLHLATVRLDTAGARIRAAAPHRDEREAVDLAEQSALRARAAAG